MSEEEYGISLVNIKQGAVVEMFDRCIEEVMENIMDPNTEAKKPREIVLKVKFAPTEDRAIIAIHATCTSKLMAQEQLVTTAIMKNGVAYENKPRQMGIFSENVKPMERSNHQ